MKTLLLLRHANSSSDHPGLIDHDRPLNEKGACEAPYIGQLIKTQQIVIDFILSSNATRAKTTTQLIAQHCGYNGPIELSAELYATDAKHYLHVLSRIEKPFKSILMVGHNPTLEDLFLRLTKTKEEFPTAGLAHLQLPIDNWGEIKSCPAAQLINFYRPKLNLST